MARQPNSKKSLGPKKAKDTIKSTNGSIIAAAVAAGYASDTVIVCPGTIKDVERLTRNGRTSSSDTENIAIDAPKLRADSMSAKKLNDMASKQLLGELEAAIGSTEGTKSRVKHPRR